MLTVIIMTIIIVYPMKDSTMPRLQNAPLPRSLALTLGLLLGSAPTLHASENQSPTTVTGVKTAVLGDWVSFAPELRPSSAKNADGILKPFYLSREFKALPGDAFQLKVVNFADPNGTTPLANILIKGHMFWRGEHPIAPGAQKVDFVADDAYEVTPLVQGFADILNKVAIDGYEKWEVGKSQSVFGRTFAPFDLAAGKHFMEYDLVYISNDLLFWGARNVDGRRFDTEANRPTNLQIPLRRN